MFQEGNKHSPCMVVIFMKHVCLLSYLFKGYHLKDQKSRTGWSRWRKLLSKSFEKLLYFFSSIFRRRKRYGNS
jgi:hypothetical protein